MKKVENSKKKEKILIRNEEIDDLRNPGKYANETRKIEEEIQFIEEIQNTNFEKEVNDHLAYFEDNRQLVKQIVKQIVDGK